MSDSDILFYFILFLKLFSSFFKKLTKNKGNTEVKAYKKIWVDYSAKYYFQIILQNIGEEEHFHGIPTELYG